MDDSILTVRQYADKLMADHVEAANPHAQSLKTTSALGEIKDAGKVAGALASLGIGEGSPMIGSPFPWPHEKLPSELFASMAGMVFLKTNGSSFSGTVYPKLAKVLQA